MLRGGNSFNALKLRQSVKQVGHHCHRNACNHELRRVMSLRPIAMSPKMVVVVSPPSFLSSYA
jgi:hypothetical protein